MKKGWPILVAVAALFFGAAAVTQVDLTTQVKNILPIANGGSGSASPSLVAGGGINVTGSWPNQTVAAAGVPGSTLARVFDEFLGGGVTTNQIGDLGWSKNGGGGSYTHNPSNSFLVDHPGIGQVAAANGSWEYIVLTDNIGVNGNPILLGTSTFDFKADVRNFTGTGGDIRFGVFSNWGSSNLPGAFFRANATGASVNWFCVTGNLAAASTSNDSGVSSASTVWHQLEVTSAASSTVVFKIDGTQVCSQNGNVDTSDTHAPGFEAVGNASGTANIWIDYADLSWTVSRQ